MDEERRMVADPEVAHPRRHMILVRCPRGTAWGGKRYAVSLWITAASS
jgi:hypothetical protein